MVKLIGKLAGVGSYLSDFIERKMNGWENVKPVVRYAHLSFKHLLEHTDILDTNWTQLKEEDRKSVKENRLNVYLDGENLVGRVGFEPTTKGL